MDHSRKNQAIWKARGDDQGSLAPFRKPRKYRTAHQPLTPEQRDLAGQFLPLARALAKPLKAIFNQWKDEFESAACLALVEAARSYDPSRNIRFATFARFRIRGALVDVGRGMAPLGIEEADPGPNVITLTPYNEEHGKVLVAVEPPPVGAEHDDVDAVEHWLKRLPSKHAQVCRLYYLYGKTQAEIAGALGCSQSEVTRLHRKSLELLSEPYDEQGRANKPTRRVRRNRDDGPGDEGPQGAPPAHACAQKIC